MKRFASLVLALVLFASPTLALAGECTGPALKDMFDRYVETILFGE